MAGFCVWLVIVAKLLVWVAVGKIVGGTAVSTGGAPHAARKIDKNWITSFFKPRAVIR